VGLLIYRDGLGGERWVYPKRGQGYGAGEAGGKERFEKHPIFKAINGIVGNRERSPGPEGCMSLVGISHCDWEGRKMASSSYVSNSRKQRGGWRRTR
jgi:hypothetical protein